MTYSHSEITRKTKLVFRPTNNIDGIIDLDINYLYAKNAGKTDEVLYKRLYKWYGDWYASRPSNIIDFKPVSSMLSAYNDKFYSLWMFNIRTLYASRLVVSYKNKTCRNAIEDLDEAINNNIYSLSIPNNCTTYRII